MPMLIPNHQSISKSIESISKTGIDIDAVVRNSLSKLSKTHSFSSKPLEASVHKTSGARMITTPSTMASFKNNNKSMPLTARNKNFLESTSKSISSAKNSRKLSRTSLLRAKIQQQKLLQKSIKKENRIDSLSEEKQELDDSLTSLQWLTGVKVNDLLEGKPIPYAPLSPAPSNCSDEDEEKRLGRPRYNSDGVIDYRTNSNLKPPYSYAALIIMAMKSKSCSKMTLSEIYKWITDNFVYYKHAEPSWQNSIRHNLSLNKCFAKIPRNKGDPGKGGYWSIVPEFADKLLESNIRKRRSSMLDYGCQEFIKRQRLELFESQLLHRIKEGLHLPTQDNNNNNLTVGNIETNSVDAATVAKIQHYKTFYKHSQQPSATFADAEQCRMDHPYGKNPFSRFVTDEDNIKAIADSLQRSATSTYNDPVTSTSVSTTAQSSSSSVSNFDLSNSMLLNTFANAIRSDCIWSAEQNLSQSGNTDMLGGSMSMVKEELLEARNLTTAVDTNLTLLAKGLTSSLNSSGGFTATFCLSPPLSGDDDTLSDDLEDDSVPFEDLDLTIRGTSMTLLNPTEDMLGGQGGVKEEPLSPESIDFHNDLNEE